MRHTICWSDKELTHGPLPGPLLQKISRNVIGSDIGQHLNSVGHDGLSDVEIHIVDFIHCSPESDSARKLRNTEELDL